MTRHLVPSSGRVLTIWLSVVVIMSSVGALVASAQPGSSQPSATCDPWGFDPCPTTSPNGSLSGGFTWTMVSTTLGGGELASTQHWDSSVTADLAWTDEYRMFLPRSGTYAYTQEYTGHCTGSVSGAGILATEPFVGASSGVASVYAEWSPLVDGSLTLNIGIWRDDYDVHCKATNAFPANEYVDPGNTERPLCTRVIATPATAAGGSFSVSCVEQDIPGVEVVVSGALVEGP